VINPNLEDQKYLCVLTSLKKKMNIVKIRTNSRKLHSETRSQTILKMSWVERIFHLHDTNKYEDEKYFPLE